MTTHTLSTAGVAHIAPRYFVLAAVLIAVGILWWVFDWNWFKHPIERRVEAATGRDFSIEGDLSVDLGLVPTPRDNQWRTACARAKTENRLAPRYPERRPGCRRHW